MLAPSSGRGLRFTCPFLYTGHMEKKVRTLFRRNGDPSYLKVVLLREILNEAEALPPIELKEGLLFPGKLFS